MELKLFKEEFEKWRKTLTADQEKEILKKATDLHVNLSDYPEVALRLHFVRKIKKTSESKLVGHALDYYFEMVW